MLLWGVNTSVVLAGETPNVVVIEDLSTYQGNEAYVFNQADGKVYVLNNVGEYERYGVYEKVSTLKIAGGGDTEIEYIESTVEGKHPYINTGYIFKENTRIVAEVNLTENEVRAYEAVYGARQSITSRAFMFFSRFASDNAGCFVRNTQEKRGDMMLPMGEKITIDASDQTCNIYVEGDEEPYTTIECDQGISDGTVPMFIFDLNFGGNRDNSWGFFKLYSFKIYEGEELVMDLKPFVASTGEAGLIDKVSGRKLYSADGSPFTVSPDGEAAASSSGITVYEGKMVLNTTDGQLYKYSNGSFTAIGEPTKTPIEFTDYKDMNNWETNSGHAAIFQDQIYYDETEDANYIDSYVGTSGYEPLMIKIPAEEGEDYNFMFHYACGPYESWHNTPMHVFVWNKYDLNTSEGGLSVGGDVLATFELPFEGQPDEDNPVLVSMDFTAQQDWATIVAQFGDCEDKISYWFSFHQLLVSKYTYPERYPVLNPFAPQLELLIPEAEAFDGNTTTAIKKLLADAIEEAKAALAGDDLLAQRAALEKLQNALAEAKNGDITLLQEIIAAADKDGVNVQPYVQLLETAATAAAVDQAVFDLKADRKIHALRTSFRYTGSAPAVDTEFYLFNVGTDLFLSMGSDWNTHAAVDQAGWPITLEAAEGGYTLHTAWGSFNGSPYVDTGVNTVYNFQLVDGYDSRYYIKDGEDRYLGWNPNGHTDGNHFWSSISNTQFEETPVDFNYMWILVPRSELVARMETASFEDPADATFYINNPSFLKLPGLDMYEKECEGGNGGARVSDNNNSDRSSDFAYEYWNTDSFNFSQTIEGLKPGLYTLTCNGFFRDGDGGHQAEIVNAGLPLRRLAYLYANDKKVPLQNIANKTIYGAVPGVPSQVSDMGNIPNWPWEAIEYFENGYYVNELAVMVGEDGVLTFGVAKDSKENWGDWVVFDNFRLTYHGISGIMAEKVCVDRYTGQGYGAQVVEVDLEPAKEFLGVDALTTDMVRVVNPDFTFISDYAMYDGWFNGEGVATQWGASTKICVKFFQAIPDGKFEMCDMNGADGIYDTYSTSWALTANGKTYIYNFETTFSNKPALDLTYDKLNILGVEQLEFKSELGKCYEGFTSDIDKDAICLLLDVESFDEVTAYAVQPDGTLDDNYKLGSTDGWRNAEGGWQSWGADAYICVKADFDAASNQIYFIGGMDGNTTEPGSYTATYVFVKDGTTDAVALTVTLVYEPADGITDLQTDKNLVIYDLAGRRVQKAQKGLYIINGQKAAVK